MSELNLDETPISKLPTIWETRVPSSMREAMITTVSCAGFTIEYIGEDGERRMAKFVNGPLGMAVDSDEPIGA